MTTVIYTPDSSDGVHFVDFSEESFLGRIEFMDHFRNKQTDTTNFFFTSLSRLF